MPTQPYLGTHPTLGEGVYIDPTALVIGDVVLGDQVSVWPMAVVRGDVNHIHIGARSNVQDGSVLHVSRPYPGNDTRLGAADRRGRRDRPQGRGARLHDR